MPIPTPNDGEGRKDFMERCMGNDKMNKEYPDSEQRAAVCNASFGKAQAAFNFVATAESVEIKAAEGSRTPTFRMVAYTGGAMNVGWGRPVVVALDGMKWSHKARPILRDHDTSKIVGHTTNIEVVDGKLIVEGVVSAGNEHAAEVIASSLAGFPWQASIGARARRDQKDAVKVLDEEDEYECNGQRFKGPCYVISKSVLGEVSFVPLGADDDTSASVTASAEDAGESVQEKERDMEKPEVAAGAPEQAHKGLTIEDVRAEAARIAAINAVCAKHPEIAKQAIEGAWSVEKAELHALKAEKVATEQNTPIGAPAVHVVAQADTDTLKAAMCAQGGMREKVLVETFGEQAVDKSRKFRRMGLKAAMAESIRRDGGIVPSLHASEQEWARAAFSSVTFTDLLGDSANKSLLAAYNAVPSVAREIAKMLSARDFKVHKGLRLTGDLTFKKVEAGGEITHGTLGDDTYTYSVDTYGRMIGLTRQDIVNDDLGAFLELPMRFGRGAALAVESAFWTLVAANTGTFFGSGNNNYIDGATTVLSITGLGLAVKEFRDQVDSDGNPIIVNPKYLVVPTALEATARQLYVSENITGGTTSVLARNIYSGAFLPLVSPYITATTTEWYLFGDPMDVPAFGIAWLNGVQAPVVEEVAVSGEYLGKMWRGYIDFGVCQLDPRGAVKSKGAA